jgi:hypothetical protein
VYARLIEGNSRYAATASTVELILTGSHGLCTEPCAKTVGILCIPNRIALAGLLDEMGQRDFAQSIAQRFIELAA